MEPDERRFETFNCGLKMIRKSIFFAAILASQTVSAVELDRLPYLQKLGPEGVTLVWRGVEVHSATVLFGTNLASLEEIKPSSFERQHAVQIGNLSPNTRYHYKILGDSGVLTPEESYSFTTPPVVGQREAFRFWVVGDSGTGGSVQYAVRDAMERYAGNSLPAMMIHVGDMAYGDGTDTEFTTYWCSRVVSRPISQGENINSQGLEFSRPMSPNQ